MKIDIRKEQTEIDSIVFGEGEDDGDAYVLSLAGDLTRIESPNTYVFIDNKEDAKNLIKALEKAIELGTWS